MTRIELHYSNQQNLQSLPNSKNAINILEAMRTDNNKKVEHTPFVGLPPC